MAKKVFKTALGKTIDIDAIRAKNEDTIAVGNMYVNARGDELGPGGVIVRRREDIMKEYYTPGGGVVTGKGSMPVGSAAAARTKQPQEPVVPLEQAIAVNHGPRQDMVRTSTIEDDQLDAEETLAVNQRDMLEARKKQQEAVQAQRMTELAPNPTMTQKPRFRGSLAEGVAQRGTTNVFQEPTEEPKKGINRI